MKKNEIFYEEKMKCSNLQTMIKQAINKTYHALILLSPWAIIAGIYQYSFRPNLKMDRFQGPEFFDFFSITDLYIIALLAVFLFAYLTNSIQLQKRPLPKTIIAGIALIFLAGFIQIEFQAVFEPVLSTPFKYFRGLFILPIAYAALIWFTLDKTHIHRLVLSYCLAIATNCTLALTQYFFNPFPGAITDFTGRLSWPFVDFITLKSASANWISFLSMPAFVISTIQLIRSVISKKFPQQNIIFLLTFLATGLALYLAQSYGSYLAIITAITIYLFQTLSRKKFLVALAVIIISSLSIYAIQRNSPKVQILEGNVDYKFNNSVTSRSDIFKMNLFMIRQRPVLGVGLNQYQSYFNIHQQAALGHTFKESHIPPHAHNFFLSFWTSLGIFGFAGIFIIMLGALCHVHFRSDHPAFFALAGIMVHGLIDSYYWRPEIAYTIWIIFTLSYLYRLPPLKKQISRG